MPCFSGDGQENPAPKNERDVVKLVGNLANNVMSHLPFFSLACASFWSP